MSTPRPPTTGKQRTDHHDGNRPIRCSQQAPDRRSVDGHETRHRKRRRQPRRSTRQAGGVLRHDMLVARFATTCWKRASQHHAGSVLRSVMLEACFATSCRKRASQHHAGSVLRSVMLEACFATTVSCCRFMLFPECIGPGRSDPGQNLDCRSVTSPRSARTGPPKF